MMVFIMRLPLLILWLHLLLYVMSMLPRIRTKHHRLHPNVMQHAASAARCGRDSIIGACGIASQRGHRTLAVYSNVIPAVTDATARRDGGMLGRQREDLRINDLLVLLVLMLFLLLLLLLLLLRMRVLGRCTGRTVPIATVESYQLSCATAPLLLLSLPLWRFPVPSGRGGRGGGIGTSHSALDLSHLLFL